MGSPILRNTHFYLRLIHPRLIHPKAITPLALLAVVTPCLKSSYHTYIFIAHSITLWITILVSFATIQWMFAQCLSLHRVRTRYKPHETTMNLYCWLCLPWESLTIGVLIEEWLWLRHQGALSLAWSGFSGNSRGFGVSQELCLTTLWKWLGFSTGKLMSWAFVERRGAFAGTFCQPKKEHVFSAEIASLALCWPIEGFWWRRWGLWRDSVSA